MVEGLRVAQLARFEDTQYCFELSVFGSPTTVLLASWLPAFYHRLNASASYKAHRGCP